MNSWVFLALGTIIGILAAIALAGAIAESNDDQLFQGVALGSAAVGVLFMGSVLKVLEAISEKIGRRDQADS